MGSKGLIRDLRMWNFEVIGALGANLWPFSFSDSVRRLPFVLMPNLGKEYIEGKEEEPKTTQIALN